jgi:hypothetical protein
MNTKRIILVAFTREELEQVEKALKTRSFTATLFHDSDKERELTSRAEISVSCALKLDSEDNLSPEFYCE